MAKEKFECNKPHVNVDTIGYADHGKITLTAALIRVYSGTWDGSACTFSQIDNTPEEKTRGIIISISYTEYDSAARHYAHVDCPGHTDYVKNTITGAAQIDGATPVCSATDDLTSQTCEYVLLSRQVGAPYVVVFLNKVDMIGDAELLELVEMEVRDPPNTYDSSGDDAPIIVDSALAALEGRDGNGIGVSATQKLVETLNSYIPEPAHAIDQPFLMPTEDVFSIFGRDTMVTDHVKHGIIKAQEEVETVGIKATTKTTCTGVEVFRRLLDEDRASESAGTLLCSTKCENVERDQILVKPGTIKSHTKFEREMYALFKEEGGRHTPLFKSYRPQPYFRTTDVTGSCELLEGVEIVVSGDNTKMVVTLIAPIAMEDGPCSAIREDGRAVDAGVVARIIE